MLGVGEAANFPASIKTVAEWFPKSERAFSTGIFNAGTNVGAVSRPDGGPAHRGGVGMAGRVHPDRCHRVHLGDRVVDHVHPVETHPRVSSTERGVERDSADELVTQKTPLSRILGKRQLWAFAMGKLMTDPVWWFYLFWLPKFLAQEHGIRGVALIPYLTTVYIVADIARWSVATCRPRSSRRDGR